MLWWIRVLQSGCDVSDMVFGFLLVEEYCYVCVWLFIFGLIWLVLVWWVLVVVCFCVSQCLFMVSRFNGCLVLLCMFCCSLVRWWIDGYSVFICGISVCMCCFSCGCSVVVRLVAWLCKCVVVCRLLFIVVCSVCWFRLLVMMGVRLLVIWLFNVCVVLFCQLCVLWLLLMC